MKIIINFASKLGVDTVSRLIGFLTLPLITRALGPDGYGQFTYLFIILSYFGFFIDFGYLNYGTNKLCEKDNTENVVGRIISLQLITAAISYIVLIIVAPFFLDPDKYILLLIFSLTFITQIFSIKYYYLSKNKLYYNSISEFAGQTVYALLVFTLFIAKPEVLTLVIISVIQTLVTAVFLILPYIKKEGIKLDFNIRINLKTLKEAYKLGLATKAEAITATFIILCLGFFVNEESVGIYNASYKIYLIMLTVVQGLSYTLMPMLLKNLKIAGSSSIRKIGLIFYLFISSGIILSVMSFVFSDQIIDIMFGEKFAGSVFLLQCFSLTILLWPLVMFFSLVILAYNKYNIVLLLSLTSMVTSIITSLIMINLKGVNGAGFILPVVASVTIIVSIFYLKKIFSERGITFTEIFSSKYLSESFREVFRKK
ncbi:MAG: oligosaccharide flippase family protein [Ignavibacteria bacterium]|nr:oligosaccharide flippase family protein [Ignavibacteria bacterium]